MGTTVIAALGWALLDFLWQGLLVGLLAALALHALRNARPQARYAVACLALALCLLLPLAGLWRGLAPAMADATPAQAFAAPVAGAMPTREINLSSPAADWQASLQSQLPAIVAAWSVGALLLALRLVLGCHWVGRLRAGARLPNSWWQGRFDELAVHVGLRAPVPIRLSDAIDTPVAAGWWRPVVLVPAALLTALPVEYIEALLAHELAHVRRRDYLVNLLQGAVETLLFYHPVVWWLSRRVRIEREQIADDLACRALAEPRQLALALQALDRFQEARARSGASLPHAPRLLPAAHGGQLMPRIKRLLRPNHQRPDWKLALPLAGLAALGLAVHAAQATSPAPPAVAPVALAPAVAPVAAAPAVAPVARVAPVALAAPVAAVAPTPRVAPVPAIAPVAAAAPVSGIRMRADRVPYAMVRAGEDGMTLSGDLDDMDEVKQARQHLHGDFLWFRRNGVGYVVQDAALIARARRAWDPAEEIGRKMEALGAQMEPHSARMEALGKQMEKYSANSEPFAREMEALGKRMEPLARQQAELGGQIARTANNRARIEEKAGVLAAREAELQRLQLQMDGLSEKMDVISREMDARGEQMRKAHEPMEALGKQMEAASRPMAELGRRMEPLGKQMEALSHQANAEVEQVIDQAVREGKAVPAKQLSK